MLRYAVETHPKLEVQGFGKVEIEPDGDISVVDIIIPPHEVQGASVDLKPEVLEQFMMALSQRGETLSDWRLWWHSHAGMGVSPSGTDTNTLEMLSKEYEGVALGMVTNVAGDYHAWYSVTQKVEYFGQHTMSGKMSVLYERYHDKKLAGLVAEMMKHVKEKKWTAPPMMGGGAVIKSFKSSDDINKRGSGRHTGSYAAYQGDLAEWYAAMQDTDEDDFLVPDLEKDAKDLAEFYKMTQATMPPGSPQAKMDMVEFAKWFDETFGSPLLNHEAEAMFSGS